MTKKSHLGKLEHELEFIYERPRSSLSLQQIFYKYTLHNVWSYKWVSFRNNQSRRRTPPNRIKITNYERFSVWKGLPIAHQCFHCILCLFGLSLHIFPIVFQLKPFGTLKSLNIENTLLTNFNHAGGINLPCISVVALL